MFLDVSRFFSLKNDKDTVENQINYLFPPPGGGGGGEGGGGGMILKVKYSPSYYTKYFDVGNLPPVNVFQQVPTDSNGFQRVSTGPNGFWRVSTGWSCT